jgi:hypothetical protein
MGRICQDKNLVYGGYIKSCQLMILDEEEHVNGGKYLKQALTNSKKILESPKRIAIFPEKECTNKTSLLQFKAGKS